MTQTFKIAPASRAATATLVGISTGCFLLAGAVAVGLSALPVVAGAAATLCAALGALFAWFAVAQGRSTVTVGNRRIELHVPLYGRSLPVDEIVADSFAKADLAKDEKFRLTWRTNGLGVPGYQLGWFRTQGAGKVLAAITTSSLVTWTNKDGSAVLISVADPDAFLLAAQNSAAS